MDWRLRDIDRLRLLAATHGDGVPESVPGDMNRLETYARVYGELRSIVSMTIACLERIDPEDMVDETDSAEALPPF